MSKILDLPIGERLWPNCLNRPIRNSSRVRVDDFIARSGKLCLKQEVGMSERVIPRSAASRTRSKQVSTPIVKGSQSIQDLSSKSQDSPQDQKDVEMSSGRRYAKGICRFLFTSSCVLLLFCMSAITLKCFEPCFLIVEFKPPIIKPLVISSKELFAKRTREDKSTDTDSSKAPLFVSPMNSPPVKKVRTDLSASTVKSDAFMPLAAHGYYLGAKPSAFAHLLNDMLLPQSMEIQSAKTVETALDDSAGYAFHVSML